MKKQADEKRRAERKQRHAQDDLRYAMKRLPELLDINLSYEEVGTFYKSATTMTSLIDLPLDCPINQGST